MTEKKVIWNEMFNRYPALNLQRENRPVMLTEVCYVIVELVKPEPRIVAISARPGPQSDDEILRLRFAVETHMGAAVSSEMIRDACAVILSQWYLDNPSQE